MKLQQEPVFPNNTEDAGTVLKAHVTGEYARDKYGHTFHRVAVVKYLNGVKIDEVIAAIQESTPFLAEEEALLMAIDNNFGWMRQALVGDMGLRWKKPAEIKNEIVPAETRQG